MKRLLIVLLVALLGIGQVGCVLAEGPKEVVAISSTDELMRSLWAAREVELRIGCYPENKPRDESVGDVVERLRVEDDCVGWCLGRSVAIVNTYSIAIVNTYLGRDVPLDKLKALATEESGR